MTPNPKPQTRITVTAAPSERHDKPEIIAEVNAVLSEYYERSTRKADALHSRFGDLLRAMHTLAMSGGKRARPYLTVLAYESYGGGHFKDICRVGASLELLHTAMLIHDDIIDRDQIRYGIENISGGYRRIYGALGGHEHDVAHYADSAAILAGDINITAAFQLMLESGFPAEHKIAAQKLLAEACFRVSGGELIDTDAIFYPLEETNPITVTEVKTAHYSFVTPLLIGATLAGANEDELAKLDRLGMRLGVAFQLEDDILGVFGDEKRTGKSAIGDIREGRRNQLLQSAYALSNEKQRATLDTYYGNPDITEKQAEQVRDVLVESGARASVEADIEKYAAEARDIIATLGIDSSARTIFDSFVTSMTKRDY